MGTTLDHGIYLPDEGERNCYEGLAGNWVALDNHLGNTDIHVTINDKQAWDGHIADTTIHVTAADKQAWNNHVADTVKHVTAEDKAKWDAVTGKADASALTAHTGDTTIHVTAEDKQAWNNHVADTVKHVTAEDKAKWDAVTDKANDSDVVHKSGDETVAGEKTFTDLMSIDGDYLGTEYSSNQRTNLQLRSNRDTAGKSGALITRFRQNRPQGGLATGDLQMLGIDFLENEVRTNNVLLVQATGWVDNVPTKVNIISAVDVSSFGSSQRPCNINNLNPSSLSLPDLSNGIDISSYFDATQISTNTYTAPDNGYINIAISSPNRGSINAVIGSDFWATTAYGAVNPNDSKSFLQCILVPILKNQTITVYLRTTGGTIESAKFFPCRGNI